MDGCRQDCSGSQYHFGDQRANSKVSFECGAGKVGLRDDNPSRCQSDRKSTDRRLTVAESNNVPGREGCSGTVEVQNWDIEKIGRGRQLIEGVVQIAGSFDGYHRR